jgi:hypothetical protein
MPAPEREAQLEAERIEARRQAAVARYHVAVAPVIEDLRAVGFEVATVQDLRRVGVPYSEAIPVLLRWLPRVEYPPLKEDIVRTLSVPWASPMALRPLLTEFERTPASEESGLRWAIGNALEVLGDDSVFEELAAIARNPAYGRSRQMVVVALGRMRNPAAAQILIDLLGDEQVAGHAVKALRRLRAPAARERLAAMSNHPKTWIRNEVKKALDAIEKEEAR